MKVPIPNDWDGKSWECIQLQWPNSPQFWGLLNGLITLMTRGRYWEESTGQITDMQLIAWEIFDRNWPFTSCNNEPIEPCPVCPTSVYGGMESEYEELAMGLCGLNPDSFKIEDGKFYVKNLCGEWELIGEMGNAPDAPTTAEIPPPPTPSYDDSTPCAQATKLATLTYDIVVASFAQMEGVETLDIWDYYTDMNDAFNGIDLSFNDLMNMWASTAALDAAGLEGETRNTDAIIYLACNWVDLIPEDNAGITADVYAEMIAVTDGALREVFPKGSHIGFGNEMRHLWERAFKSIGAKDVAKISTYAQPMLGQNCDCPDYNSPTDPTASGWYLSKFIDVVITSTGSYNTYGCAKFVAEHDAYGVAVQAHWTAAPVAGLVPVAAATASCGAYDVNGWPDTSQQLQYEAQGTDFAGMLAAPANEVFGIDGWEDLECSYETASIPAPGVEKGEVVAHGFDCRDLDDGEIVTIRARLLFNTGSPSHD